MQTFGPRAARPGFRPADISALVHRKVVAVHASEAAFLWAQRDRAVASPHYGLRHLSRVDERLIAHLRGLQVAGDSGWAAARNGLAETTPGSVFVVSYLAFADQKREHMTAALNLGLADPRFEAALTDALCWVDGAQLAPVLDLLATSEAQELRRISLAARAAHRALDTATLRTAAASPDAALRTAALRAICELRRTELLPIALDAVRDSHKTCSLWAALSCTSLGQAHHASLALEDAESVPEFAGLASEIAFRFGERDWATDAIRKLAASPDTRRTAIRAVGAYGDPAAIPWLLDEMEGRHSRLAGEAYAAITGADLAFLDLDRDGPDDGEEIDESDNDLPWPDADAMRSHWANIGQTYRAGTRHLGGEKVSAFAAIRVLREGFQRQRRGAAVERMRHDPAATFFPVHARADRQFSLLAS